MFTGLEELTLDNLYEELPWWKSQIVQVLKNSPGLRKLTLSLSVDTIARYEEFDERDTFETFFDDLCHDYGETGAAPLPIQSLDLGTAIFPYELSSLEKLVKLCELEEVRIENLRVSLHYDEDAVIELYGLDGESGIVFDAFGPTRCPKLRRFNAWDYRGDIHGFLATMNPSFTRQLAVSCKVTGAGYEPAALLRADPEHPLLPLHLRMMDIDLRREKVYYRNGQDGEELGDGYVPQVEEVLEDLVSGDDGTLEGLKVNLPEDPTAECGLPHLDLLSNALVKLVNLTQLSVKPYYHYGETQLTRETFLNAANKLAAAVPSLRYVKVYWRHWKIWRDTEGTIKLEELEDREITDVELFGQDYDRING